jgi:hypothetical protein
MMRAFLIWAARLLLRWGTGYHVHRNRGKRNIRSADSNTEQSKLI